MRRPAFTLITLSAALAAVTAALPVHADEDREGRHKEGRFHEERHEEGRFHEPGRFREGGSWHGGIERFHERDFHVWREGHWEHRYNDGRYGWWWLAAGSWYFYPAPVYPYPDPYQPPVVVTPPVVIAPSPAAPPPPQYWYYCDPAGGYYPDIPVCPSGWRVVPAAPVR
jgi:hypothetical protein